MRDRGRVKSGKQTETYVTSLLHTLWDQIGGWVGLIAYITGIVSVVYAVRNHIGTWPNNIISVVLFGYIFWIAKDPSNAALQVLYYLPISIYGWYVWLRCGPTKNDDLPVTVLSVSHRVQWVLGTIVVSLVWGYLEARFKTDVTQPYCDAATTVISIVAQYLQTKKRFENWILWILVDLIYAFYLFPAQHLNALATLYILFLIMAFVGARHWTSILRSQRDLESANLSV